jgi:hypothetical protein
MDSNLADEELGRSATADQGEIVGLTHKLNKPNTGIEVCDLVSLWSN